MHVDVTPPSDEEIRDKAAVTHTVGDFFAETWPLLFFGGIFYLMVSLPLVLSGVMPIQGLLLLTVGLISLGMVVFVPRFLGLLPLALSLVLLFYAPQPIGFVFYGVFILYMVLGNLVLPQLKKSKRQDPK